MRGIAMGAILALAVTPALWALDDKKDPPKTGTKPLTPLSTKDADKVKDEDKAEVGSKAAQEVKKLIEDFQKEQQEYYKDLREAKTPEEREKLSGKAPKWETVAVRLLELAEANPKDAGVCPKALISVVAGLGYDAGPDAAKRKEKALGILLKNHTESDQLGPMCMSLVYDPSAGAEEFLRAVLDKNPKKDIKGRACIGLAQMLKNQLEPSAVKKRADPEKVNKEMEKLFETAAKEYADIVLYPKHTIGDMANGELFEIRHLAVGMAAPEIEAEDLEGKALKLSDYRGKVVLLDFWGNW